MKNVTDNPRLKYRVLRWVTPAFFGCCCFFFAVVMAFHQVIPRVVGAGELDGARPGWYLRSGQLTADAKTLAAGFKFVMGIQDSLPPTLPQTSPASQLAAWQNGTLLATTNTGTNVPTA